jgi:putative hydrolase of the HAD superfamily
MKKYKAIIFDVGDTLVKWFPNRSQIYAERLRKVGIAVDESLSLFISDAIYRAEGEQTRKEQNGVPHMSTEEFCTMLDRAAVSCTKILPEKIDDLVEELKKIPLPKQIMVVIPGVHDLLNKLKNVGYRLAIVSNHRARLIDFLKDENLYDFFETVVISEIVGVEKPNVRIMEIALERLELSAQDCLYVGDHEMDVLCSKQAGLDMAWIASPSAVLLDDIHYTEDYRISSILDIANILL